MEETEHQCLIAGLFLVPLNLGAGVTTFRVLVACVVDGEAVPIGTYAGEIRKIKLRYIETDATVIADYFIRFGGMVLRATPQVLEGKIVVVV